MFVRYSSLGLYIALDHQLEAEGFHKKILYEGD